MFFGRALTNSKLLDCARNKIYDSYFKHLSCSTLNTSCEYFHNQPSFRDTRFCKTNLLCSNVRLMASGPSTSTKKSSQNRLSKERSPYLLQHASNPVNWYPWGEEAFALARSEDKLIFLSVGYSTCHWCHVMERESFEDIATASIMNDYFVNIKVDREERPDVDRTYMTFVQVSSGGGGWPMSVFLTPDLKPVAGGTYFPPEDSFGRPSFKTVLLNVAKQWMEQRGKVITTSHNITELLRETTAFDVGVAGALLSGETPGRDIVINCCKQLKQSYDRRWGGFSPAPKFPQASILNLLLSLGPELPDAKEMALKTLDFMRRGGINDHISKGFARYSTDEKWHVPHFEKMLYDEGQLAVAYIEAFVQSGDESYAQTARDILEYVSRDLSHCEGGFYSAEDADSYPSKECKEKKEGAFCVWTHDEVSSLLSGLSFPSKPDVSLAEVFSYYFGIKPQGNVNPNQDPHGELVNQNVLMVQPPSNQDVCIKFSLQEDELKDGLAKAKSILFEARKLRPRPQLDDKIITAWNGLMISGYARAAFVLKSCSLQERAERAANFIKKYLYTETKRLLRSCYTQGPGVAHIDRPIEGFLEDYAFFIRGLIDLYECTLDESWLAWASELQTTQDNLFWDHGLAGYFSTTSGDNSLLFRLKDDQDGAEPCGNSVAAGNLIRLSAMIDSPNLRSNAAKIFSSFGNRLSRFPRALPEMCSALRLYHDTPTTVVITGSKGNAETMALVDALRRRPLPGMILMLATGDPASFLASRNPAIAKMKKVGGRESAYVCRSHTCSLPVTSPEDLVALLRT